MDTAIRLLNIAKWYDKDTPSEVHALDSISFEVQKGEFVAIMGTSGSGKSTLLHILGLLDKPSEGQYLIDGTSVEELSASDSARKRNEEIGFVFQSFNLLKRTSVYQNIELPLLYSKTIPKKERSAKILQVLKNVGLEKRKKAYINELSGGQQQRVAIARALVTDPAFLLADEPTGNLDTKTGMEIMNILLELNKNNGTTVVVVTHDSEIAALAPRRIVLRDGKITEDIRP